MAATEVTAEPETVAAWFWSLASLLEAWDEAHDEGRALSEGEVDQAAAPIWIDPDGDEVGVLAPISADVRMTLARSLGAATRELKLCLKEKGDDAQRGDAVTEARKRICGSLRIVKKLGSEDLPGWLDDCWTLHGC